ncbi:MAG: hypothetical protein OXD29_06450 [Roseovarius sp.]|nr:hypothetical protein [Roseovarius sp.]
MVKVLSSISGAIIGGFAAAGALVTYLDWGTPGAGQVTHIDPTRADYVDLLLSLVVVLLSAVGLAITVGALVIGLVAFKTLREIKNDAEKAAQTAAETKIRETMDSDLEPNVTEKVGEILPGALRAALLNNETGHQIFSEMARKGELDAVLERVAMRMQGAGPETDEGS